MQCTLGEHVCVQSNTEDISNNYTLRMSWCWVCYFCFSSSGLREQSSLLTLPHARPPPFPD